MPRPYLLVVIADCVASRRAIRQKILSSGLPHPTKQPLIYLLRVHRLGMTYLPPSSLPDGCHSGKCVEC